jgi:hypothetical protein
VIVVLARAGAADAVAGTRSEVGPALNTMARAVAEIRDFQAFMIDGSFLLGCLNGS